jgi:hypothetical protein
MGLCASDLPRCFTPDSDSTLWSIEQNASKPSRWGQLAREGPQVVQFKNVGTNKFVAVAVDGEVTVYGAGHRARKQ